MSSDLDVLIDFYQWEKQRLLLSIEENKRDQDFIAVDYNYQELRHIQQELDRLLELKDPNYPQIKRLEKEIEFYSKKEEPFFGFSELNAPMLKKAEEELKKLKLQKPIPPSEETQILDEALFSLINEEIKGFTIYLDLMKQTYIDVVKIETGHIQLNLVQEPYGSDLRFLKKYVFKDEPKSTYDESSKSLVALLEVNRYKNVLPIKEIISRIVIGSKYWLGLEDTIFLKLKP